MSYTSRVRPSSLAPYLIAVCVAVGFGYAAFGVVTALTNILVGARLWVLEVGVGVLAAWATLVWMQRLQTRQTSSPRLDRGERAIWRLSYRRGNLLALEEIVRETLLDEGAALAALRSLEAQGQARLEDDGRWRLLEAR